MKLIATYLNWQVLLEKNVYHRQEANEHSFFFNWRKALNRKHASASSVTESAWQMKVKITCERRYVFFLVELFRNLYPQVSVSNKKLKQLQFCVSNFYPTLLIITIKVIFGGYTYLCCYPDIFKILLNNDIYNYRPKL